MTRSVQKPPEWWRRIFLRLFINIKTDIRLSEVKCYSRFKTFPFPVFPGFYSQQPDYTVKCPGITVCGFMSHGIQYPAEPFRYCFCHICHYRNIIVRITYNRKKTIKVIIRAFMNCPVGVTILSTDPYLVLNRW